MGAQLNTREQREFLMAHGFEPERGAKGSHELWVHPEFNALLPQNPSMAIPDNLMKNRNMGHNFAKVVLAADAGSGTWSKIAKLAEWCHEQTEKVKAASAKAEKIGTITRQFRDNGRSAYDWRAQNRKYTPAPAQQMGI